MTRRILVAGIGNIFLADDGFGVELARRLQQRPQPAGVLVMDFGIRGMNLAYALLDRYDAVILLDTVIRGEPPGTLYLIEPRIDDEQVVSLDTHGMDPVKVLALARALGAEPTPTYLVACEPALLIDASNSIDVLAQLSEPVSEAIEEAVRMVESLLEEIIGSASAASEPAEFMLNGSERS